MAGSDSPHAATGQAVNKMPGFVSEPNFEDEISIDCEDDHRQQNDFLGAETAKVRQSLDQPSQDSASKTRNNQMPANQISATSITNTALVGNVAKLKNSKLYQKFMKNKDTPSAAAGPNMMAAQQSNSAATSAAQTPQSQQQVAPGKIAKK